MSRGLLSESTTTRDCILYFPAPCGLAVDKRLPPVWRRTAPPAKQVVNAGEITHPCHRCFFVSWASSSQASQLGISVFLFFPYQICARTAAYTARSGSLLCLSVLMPCGGLEEPQGPPLLTSTRLRWNRQHCCSGFCGCVPRL